MSNSQITDSNSEYRKVSLVKKLVIDVSDSIRVIVERDVIDLQQFSYSSNSWYSALVLTWDEFEFMVEQINKYKKEIRGD